MSRPMGAWVLLLVFVSQALTLSAVGKGMARKKIWTSAGAGRTPLVHAGAGVACRGRVQIAALLSGNSGRLLLARLEHERFWLHVRHLGLRGGGADNTRYYTVLGLDKGCDDEDAIKKAYKKMAMKWHPDRHKGDKTLAEKKFKELSEAYQVLSDKDKKAFYDQHGEENLKASMNGSPDGKPQAPPPSEFGGYGTEGFGPNVRFSTGGGGQDFDMSDFGFGDGGGFGSFGDPFKIFEEHFGGSFGGGSFGGGGSSRRSMRESASRHPPVQKPLPCTLEELYAGCVKKFRVGDAPRQEIVTIQVKPGWKAGTKVSFENMRPPITFIIEEKRHKWFVRDGDDLVWACTVSRPQADKGVKLTIPLLDGTEHKVQTEPRQIFHGYCSVARGKGMPIKGGPKRGDLKIEFKISK